jgi:hypothetical protein
LPIKRRRLDAREHSQAAHHRPVELRRCLVAANGLRRRDAEHQQTGFPEPEVRIVQVVERPDEESGAHEQDEAQRDLGGDHELTGAALAPIRRDVEGGALQDHPNRRAGRTTEWRQAKHRRGEHRQAEREQQDVSIGGERDVEL